eukprot:1149665-Pelagomonas_calceolata.AAC.3
MPDCAMQGKGLQERNVKCFALHGELQILRPISAGDAGSSQRSTYCAYSLTRNDFPYHCRRSGERDELSLRRGFLGFNFTINQQIDREAGQLGWLPKPKVIIELHIFTRATNSLRSRYEGLEGKATVKKVAACAYFPDKARRVEVMIKWVWFRSFNVPEDDSKEVLHTNVKEGGGESKQQLFLFQGARFILSAPRSSTGIDSNPPNPN